MSEYNSYDFFSYRSNFFETFPKPPSKLKVDNTLTFEKSSMKKDVYKFLENIGAIYDDNSVSGWCKLNQDVATHTDGYGKCLLYCHSGACTFFIEKANGGMKPIPMSQGSYLVFNDSLEHGLRVDTKSTTLLVVGVKKYLNTQDEDFFKGNFK
jgi:hypothetical protein